MEELLKDSPPIVTVRPGELVEGSVVFRGKNKLLIDILGVATGIVTGRELRDSFNTFKDLHIGDTISAMVLEDENEEGMIVMSLRMASQQKAWERFHDLVEGEETMKFTAQEANRGGLIANIDGIRAFLPVSQLAPMNYPRVNNADPMEIIKRLEKFLGHTFTVKIITMDEEAGKIVISEREALSEQRAKAFESLKIGDVKDGVISGIVKFGLFVAFEGLEGLVHISEIAWGHVKNPGEYAQIGDKVQVEVIGVDGEKLSLSIKQLTKDPWEEIAERYPVGKVVEGTIVRFADYGAFLKIERDINGLVHLSELAHYKVQDPSEILTIGEKIKAQVINIDIDERRIGLSVKAITPIDEKALEKIRQQEAEEEAMKTAEEEAKAAEETEVKEESKKETKETEEVKAEEEPKKEETKAKPEEKETKAAPAETAETEKKFVASKAGKKYYPMDAPQGQKIKEENRLYFKTAEEAEAAGYSA